MGDGRSVTSSGKAGSNNLTKRAALWEARQGALEVFIETVHKAAVCPLQPLANFIDEAVDFQHPIRDNREPAATGLDGLRVVQLTLAMAAGMPTQGWTESTRGRSEHAKE